MRALEALLDAGSQVEDYGEPCPEIYNRDRLVR